MFLNWSVKSAGYTAQKWVARPFWVGRRLFTAKETTSTKNVNLNAFLMRDFYFKRRAWKLFTLLSDHLTPRHSMERKSVWEKHAVPIQRSDEMLTGLMSVSLFHVIFITRCEIKSLSPQKKTNCPVRGCAGGARSLALARMRRHAVMLYNFTKAQKLQACSSTVK